ncbi:aspartate carbamoyltransferase catalytic subunit [Legionella oakridgensis]|uniref:aspartate carbamoyltransferase catalytic subunit n=1 Tax=Legionella oakridgensis TaxID=29423 RepID=UPI0003DE097C|nr:aspartate carbamoyltransferase catalytic subunit [Legionella oakridgensis]ETO92561.1 aspartate carbamoyltransferase [Legionella oakridgensis RV-2-2007]
MRHFLQISQLSRQEAERLIERALIFKNHGRFPTYAQHTVANLFYENSTRTRVSFELAAKHLKMPVVNLDLQSSSEKKGEVIEDTIKTLAAMGISLMVIRHAKDGLPQSLAAQCGDMIQIINAGDGRHAHPSQAMLDMMTIMELKPYLERLKIAIIGDIRHSRVANSMQTLCSLMGVGELIFVAPEIWQPHSVEFGHVTSSLQDGIKDADVVMCLRVQRERLSASEHLDVETYRRDYALTRDTLAYAKTDAIVMHPGPMNRGIEIDNDVADGPQSVILRQVGNGVFMRMAIFDLLCKAA